MRALTIAASAALLLAVADRHASARAVPRTIALSGTFAAALEDSTAGPRVAALDSTIEAVVRAQGFAVVRRDVVDALEKHLTDSLGGPYDAVTGKRDTARARLIDDAVRRALRERHGAELWMRPFLIVESVGFWGGEAKWRGAVEKTGAMGGVGGVLLGTKSGKLPALSLAVFVEDSTGKTVYNGGGGLQLVVKANGLAKKPSRVPPDRLLVDPAVVSHAVHWALDSLAAELGVERR